MTDSLWPDCGNILSPLCLKERRHQAFSKNGTFLPLWGSSTILQYHHVYGCSLSLFTLHVHMSHRWPWKGLFVELSTSIGSVWALFPPPPIAVIGQHSLKLTYITNKFLLPSYFSIHLNQIITLKTEAVCSSETLEHISTTRSKNPQK
jgi:hypothetical protein